MAESMLTQLILPICLFIIMLGIGLSLMPTDFNRVLQFPRAAIIGLVGQLIVLPVFGFLIAFWLLDEPAFAIGLMLLAASPGGITSNLFSHLARADLALSVSLTAISSILTLLTLPLIMGLSISIFANDPSGASGTVVLDGKRTFFTLFLMTIVPISCGMWLKSRWPDIAIKAERHIRWFASMFLFFLVIGIAYQQRDTLLDSLATAGPATLLLNVSTMAAGLFLARIGGLNAAQSTSVTIEVGMQNAALAMLIATSVLNAPQIAIPAAVYGIVMNLTGGLVIGFRAKQTRLESLRVNS